MTRIAGADGRCDTPPVGSADHRSDLLPTWRTAALLVLVVGTLAGCSSASTASGPSAATDGAASAACHYPLPAHPVVATRVHGSSTDWTVRSFDGTLIRAHWFPLSSYVPGSGTGPHPTVLMGPGWGLAGDTDTQTVSTESTALLGGIQIRDLLDAGYNVLTWDPRGFGASGGLAEVDSPADEGRDVSTLIDWLATLPGVQLDAPGDPRVGMVGGSYGGGIQLVAAATDCRIDAIVPTIAWHSLSTSLDKASTPKIGWATVLVGAASTDHLAPEVRGTYETTLATGRTTPTEAAWFAARGPGALVARVRAPTLLLQGTVDTLFTLQEGVDNYEMLRAHGVPTAMQWFCGGHGVCLTPAGNPLAGEEATLVWLKRYLQRDTSVATGPGFTFVDQDGLTYSAPSYPPPTGVPITASGSGTLPLVATGGAGPLTSIPAGASSQTLSGLVAPITPAPATNAVDVPITVERSGVVVGAPRLTLTYHGTAGTGSRPMRVFAQLVDTATGLVLGNQVTPIPVDLDGSTHSTSVPLEMVAYTAAASPHLELQLVATTVAYAQPRLGGAVAFTGIHLVLPTATGLRAQA